MDEEQKPRFTDLERLYLQIFARLARLIAELSIETGALRGIISEIGPLTTDQIAERIEAYRVEHHEEISGRVAEIMNPESYADQNPA